MTYKIGPPGALHPKNFLISLSWYLQRFDHFSKSKLYENRHASRPSRCGEVYVRQGNTPARRLSGRHGPYPERAPARTTSGHTEGVAPTSGHLPLHLHVLVQHSGPDPGAEEILAFIRAHRTDIDVCLPHRGSVGAADRPGRPRPPANSGSIPVVSSVRAPQCG